METIYSMLKEKGSAMGKIKRNLQFFGMLALVFIFAFLQKIESRAEDTTDGLGASLTVYDKEGKQLNFDSCIAIYEDEHVLWVLKDNITIKGKPSIHEDILLYCDDNITELTLEDVNIGCYYAKREQFAAVEVFVGCDTFSLNINGNCKFTGDCLVYTDVPSGQPDRTFNLKGNGSLSVSPQNPITFLSTYTWDSNRINLVVSGDLAVCANNCDYLIDWAGYTDIKICDNVKLSGSAKDSFINTSGKLIVCDNAYVDAVAGSYVLLSSSQLYLQGSSVVKGAACGGVLYAEDLISIEDDASIEAVIDVEDVPEPCQALGCYGTVSVNTTGTVKAENNNGLAIAASKLDVKDGLVYLRGYFEGNEDENLPECGALGVGECSLGDEICVFGSEELDTPYESVDKEVYLKEHTIGMVGYFDDDDKHVKTLVFAKDCKLFFETNGAESIEACTIRAGKLPLLPKDPTRENYIFEGWYTDKECNNKFDANMPIKLDTVVYAGWAEVYKFSFETNGAASIEACIVRAGKLPSLPKDPTRENYIFEGWYTDKEFNIRFDANMPITQNTVIYAKWSEKSSVKPTEEPKEEPKDSPKEEHVKEYKLSFETNGAPSISECVVKEDMLPLLPENPIRDGFVFEGWYTDTACTELFDATKPLTQDIVIFAKWTYIRKANTITVKDVFKEYSTGKQTIRLNAKADDRAKLTYTSGNKKVKVDSKGKVTIPAKFCGTVKIKISSAETDKYKKTSKTVIITVTSPTPKFSKAVADKKSAKLTWKSLKDADGYEISYADNKEFNKAKKVTVKKKVSSAVIKKLSSKKTCYFRIRSYKKSGSKKIYSDFSAVKKLKIK